MAAGDELIDNFNQAYLKNRITDGPVEVMFDGVNQTWKPGETRAIPRAYVGHFLRGADIVKDPTSSRIRLTSTRQYASSLSST